MSPPASRPPFDAAHLDRLMDEAGIDVLVATSKHNVQYLLGGYRFFFYNTMEAMGVSRYVPVVVYPKGRPDAAAYIGCTMENFERELGRFWTPSLDLGAVGARAAMARAAVHIGKLGPVRRVAVEASFLPADGDAELRRSLSNCAIVDATLPLERLRARKTPEEIDCLREASERVIAAMGAVFAQHCRPGTSKAEIAEALRREEVNRGLSFDYCLITAGTSLNRAPSEQLVAAGDIISLDSGGNYRGYIGDLCRMGIVGEPDSELVDMLAYVEDVQQAARTAIAPGRLGGDVFGVAEKVVAASPHGARTQFTAHGMGLVSHEAPRLRDYPGLSYEGSDANRPLAPGMVISVETTLLDTRRGFIKLEDTLLVTAAGHEALGDGGRGWNRAG